MQHTKNKALTYTHSHAFVCAKSGASHIERWENKNKYLREKNTPSRNWGVVSDKSEWPAELVYHHVAFTITHTRKHKSLCVCTAPRELPLLLISGRKNNMKRRTRSVSAMPRWAMCVRCEEFLIFAPAQTMRVTYALPLKYNSLARIESTNMPAAKRTAKTTREKSRQREEDSGELWAFAESAHAATNYFVCTSCNFLNLFFLFIILSVVCFWIHILVCSLLPIYFMSCKILGNFLCMSPLSTFIQLPFVFLQPLPRIFLWVLYSFGNFMS